MHTTTSSRRHFIKKTSITLAATSFVGFSPLACQPTANMSIQDAINTIMSKIPGARNPNTVDTVKSGNPDQQLTGIVTTFMATVAVIRTAIDKGANLIITHEPTYYNHRDETEWLGDDPVYAYKRKLLEDNQIVVWRFHDYWHQERPDGILHGFLDEVGWQSYLNPDLENSCIIPQTNLQDLASFFKEKMGLKRTFYVGNGDQSCTKIGILPGAWGKDNHIPFLRKDIEVLVIGEANEWETIEYGRDAALAGMNKGLIVLGHAKSEEPGMYYLVAWLNKHLQGVAVHHVPAEDPFIPV